MFCFFPRWFLFVWCQKVVCKMCNKYDDNIQYYMNSGHIYIIYYIWVRRGVCFYLTLYGLINYSNKTKTKIKPNFYCILQILIFFFLIQSCITSFLFILMPIPNDSWLFPSSTRVCMCVCAFILLFLMICVLVIWIDVYIWDIHICVCECMLCAFPYTVYSVHCKQYTEHTLNFYDISRSQLILGRLPVLLRMWACNNRKVLRRERTIRSG